MIKEFEFLTKPLNEEELYISKVLVNAFNAMPKGKEHVRTASFMIERLATLGIDIKDTRLRKLIQYIRVNNLIFGLCSTSNGYYIASTQQEFYDTLLSLKERIEVQTSTFYALRQQYKLLYETSPTQTESES